MWKLEKMAAIPQPSFCRVMKLFVRLVCPGGDVTERQVSYSDPGSASSSPEGSNGNLAGSGEGAKSKARRRVEERWKSGMRRASDCLRDVIQRCRQQLLCNDVDKTQVNAFMPAHGYAQDAVSEKMFYHSNTVLYSLAIGIFAFSYTVYGYGRLESNLTLNNTSWLHINKVLTV